MDCWRNPSTATVIGRDTGWVSMCSDNVIPLNNVTKLDLPPDRVLDGAKGKLEGLIIIGYDTDGDEYFASTYADGGEVLWLIERCKKALLEI